MEHLIKGIKGFSMTAAVVLLLLGSLAASGQDQNPATDVVPDSANLHKEMLKHNPETRYDDEVLKTDLPEEVSSSIKESYGEYDIKKAFQARDGSYKVILGDGSEKVNVYYSINGKLLHEEKNEESEEDK